MRRLRKKAIAFMLMVSVCLGSTNLTVLAQENTWIQSTEQAVDLSQNVELTEVQQEQEDYFDIECTIYEAEGFQVVNRLKDRWDGGFNASFVVKNTSDMDIRNWYIRFPAQFEIANIWNAEIESVQDGVYLIKNVGWNSVIEAGGCVQFGVTVYENFTEFPDDYEILGTNVKVSEDVYEIAYEIYNDWGTGFTGAIIISNMSSEVIEDWKLAFDFENEYTDIWNANILSHDGVHYELQNAGYNGNIGVGESVFIGFVVGSGDSKGVMSNVSLSAFSLGGTMENEKADTQEAECYLKTVAEDDIIFDEEEGIYYVKNQIIVSTHLGASKELMRTLTEELDADIVGYIELIADYQLEFREEMTYTELRDKIAYVTELPFVRYAELNLATPTEVQYFSSDYNSWDWSDRFVGGNNWGLEALNVPKAWDYKNQFKGSVKVGVYDNMFGQNEDLVYAGLYENPGKITSYHGTLVAGIIGAKHDNGKGISGVATDVKLYGHTWGATLEESLAVFIKMLGQGIRVINVSTSYTDDVIYSATICKSGKAYDAVMDEAGKATIILGGLIDCGYDFTFVVAAGNGNGKTYVKDPEGAYEYSVFDSDKPEHTSLDKIVGHPDAKYSFFLTAIDDEDIKDRIIVVGAVQDLGNQQFSVAAFSQEGSRVDTYAPGVDILSTVPQKEYGVAYMKDSGTSCAAPYISGLAALMLQANPDLTSVQIKSIIKNSSNKEYRVGTLKYMPDAEKCVKAALNASN